MENLNTKQYLNETIQNILENLSHISPNGMNISHYNDKTPNYK